MYGNFEGFPLNSVFFWLMLYHGSWGAFLPRFLLADKKREFYGVKKEWVDGFELIPIIDVGSPGVCCSKHIWAVLSD